MKSSDDLKTTEIKLPTVTVRVSDMVKVACPHCKRTFFTNVVKEQSCPYGSSGTIPRGRADCIGRVVLERDKVEPV